VQPNRERKSIGAEDTFREDIGTIDEARKMTVPLVEKVWTVCQNRNLYGRTVTLKVKFSDFEQITRSRSRPLALTSDVEVLATVEELLASTFPPTKPVRLLGVTISNFDRDRDRTVNEQQMMLPIS
jgi:DNA polymerase-4